MCLLVSLTHIEEVSQSLSRRHRMEKCFQQRWRAPCDIRTMIVPDVAAELQVPQVGTRDESAGELRFAPERDVRDQQVAVITPHPDD